jgi:NodT family efflux transporter outer membrane factor (OMF) lipoprotein
VRELVMSRSPCPPVLAFVAAALLSACASKPLPQPAPESVPNAWVLATPHSTPAAEPLQAWWTQLGDAQLDRLIDQGLAANADVRVMAAKLKRAQASADLAGAVRRPELGGSTSAARERMPVSTTRDVDGTTVSTPAYVQSRTGLQADVRYEVDLLGRLALSEQAANAERAASAADLRAIRQWLALEIVQAYAELRLVDDHILSAQTASALLEQLQEAERRRLAAGLITRNDLRVVERQRADKLDEQAELQRQRAAAAARLAELVGQAPAEVALAPSVQWSTRVELTGAVAPDLPAGVIERRPDVAAAWQRVMAAHQSAQSVHLERYPALTLTGSTGFASTSLRRWLTGDALVWVAQAALQALFLDGGRNRARANEALAAVEELRAQHRKLVLQALGEVETALTATAVARQRVDLAQAELLRRAADRSSARTALTAGVANRSNLLQAELAESAAHDAMLQRRHELLLAWAAAHRALGQ